MKFTKNQIIAARNNGIIYLVYGINPQSKTYHVKALFVPEIADQRIKEGNKFNVSFSKENKYIAITNG